MARSDIQTVSAWIHGRQISRLKFSELWKIILIRVADCAHDLVDEEGQSIQSLNRPYNYDLTLIAEEIKIKVQAQELQRVALYLQDHGFGKLTRRSPLKMALTREGIEEAERILGEVSDIEVVRSPNPTRASWFRGRDEPLQDWLLVHAYRVSEVGKPFCEDGMVNFREVANHNPRRITDDELRSCLSDLESRDMIACDSGPTEGEFWAYFNSAGQVAAELLDDIWSMREHLPASDRFVRLDDNSLSFGEAVSSLEHLLAGMLDVRVNDWPEKEGMMASVRSTVETIQTKYVNRTTVLAAISSVATFLMTRFADAPISELAKVAWTAVKNLF